MRHIIINLIILALVTGFMAYKFDETLFNIILTISNDTRGNEVNKQLDIFQVKRYLLEKIPV